MVSPYRWRGAAYRGGDECPARPALRRDHRRGGTQRTRRRDAAGPGRDVACSCSSAASRPAAPRSRRPRSTASTRGCRATPTWSACSRARCWPSSASACELRRRRVSSYTPARGRTALLVCDDETRTRASFARTLGSHRGWTAMQELAAMTERAGRAGLRLAHRAAAVARGVRRPGRRPRRLGGPVRASARQPAARALRRRPRARDRRHRRPDRDLRRHWTTRACVRTAASCTT